MSWQMSVTHFEVTEEVGLGHESQSHEDFLDEPTGSVNGDHFESL